eukprot:5387567-Pyramimonas_sp.AAC.1
MDSAPSSAKRSAVEPFRSTFILTNLLNKCEWKFKRGAPPTSSARLSLVTLSAPSGHVASSPPRAS